MAAKKKAVKRKAYKKHSDTYYVLLPPDCDLKKFFPEPPKESAPDAIMNMTMAFPLCPNPSRNSLKSKRVRRAKITIEMVD